MNDKDHLISLAYPGGREALDTYVKARIDAGVSWRKIRDEVNGFFNAGVVVSHEWLRQQYGKKAA